MSQTLINDVLQRITHDTKLIRLSFITSFCHTLSVIFMFVLSINNVMVGRFEKGIATGDALKAILEFGAQSNIISFLIIAIVIVIIGYGIIYPIGQAAMIYYLDSKSSRISQSLAMGANYFFPMFELTAISSTFSLVNFILIILRLYMLDIQSSIFMKILMGIWLVCILVISVLRPYTKFAITLENRGVFDAIKRSGNLSLHNLVPTIKFVCIELVLLVRFLINTVIIIGIPFLLVYIAMSLNLLDYAAVQYIVIIAIIILLLGTTYINALIEAFFVTYWYKIYHKISSSNTTENSPIAHENN